MAGQARKSVRVNFSILRQLRYVVQRGAFCVGEKRAGPIFIERIKLGLVDRRFDRDGSADIHTERTNVDPRHSLTNKQRHRWRQRQLFIEPTNFGVKEAKSGWQSRTVYFQRRQYLAELPAGKEIGQLQHQALWFFDGRKEWSVHSLILWKLV